MQNAKKGRREEKEHFLSFLNPDVLSGVMQMLVCPATVIEKYISFSFGIIYKVC